MLVLVAAKYNTSLKTVKLAGDESKTFGLMSDTRVGEPLPVYLHSSAPFKPSLALKYRASL